MSSMDRGSRKNIIALSEKAAVDFVGSRLYEQIPDDRYMFNIPKDLIGSPTPFDGLELKCWEWDIDIGLMEKLDRLIVDGNAAMPFTAEERSKMEMMDKYYNIPLFGVVARGGLNDPKNVCILFPLLIAILRNNRRLNPSANLDGDIRGGLQWDTAAAAAGREDILQWALEEDAFTIRFPIVFEWAAFSGQIHILDWCCDNGRLPTGSGIYHELISVVNYAIYAGKLDVIRWIRDRFGFYFDSSDLEDAVRKSSVEMVSLLIDYGSEITSEVKEIARQRGRADIINLLDSRSRVTN